MKNRWKWRWKLLEMIENEGRMIGIISHVREYRERILQKVVVSNRWQWTKQNSYKTLEKGEESEAYEMEYSRKSH